MARFVLMGTAIIVAIVILARLIGGAKLSTVEWIMLVVILAGFAPVIIYILSTN